MTPPSPGPAIPATYLDFSFQFKCTELVLVSYLVIHLLNMLSMSVLYQNLCRKHLHVFTIQQQA